MRRPYRSKSSGRQRVASSSALRDTSNLHDGADPPSAPTPDMDAIDLSASQEDAYFLLFGSRSAADASASSLGMPGHSSVGAADDAAAFETPARSLALPPGPPAEEPAARNADSRSTPGSAEHLEPRAVDERVIRMAMAPVDSSGGVASGADGAGSELGGVPRADAHRKETERAVKRALRGAAAERDAAVQRALDEAREAHAAELAAERARRDDALARAVSTAVQNARAEHEAQLTAERAAQAEEAARALEHGVQAARHEAEQEKAAALRELAASHAEAAARWAAEREAQSARALKAQHRAVAEASTAARRRYEAELEAERKRLTEAKDKALKAASASAQRAREVAVAKAVAAATAEAEAARERSLAEQRERLHREKERDMRELKAALSAEAASLQRDAEAARAHAGLEVAQAQQQAALRVRARAPAVRRPR